MTSGQLRAIGSLSTLRRDFSTAHMVEIRAPSDSPNAIDAAKAAMLSSFPTATLMEERGLLLRYSVPADRSDGGGAPEEGRGVQARLFEELEVKRTEGVIRDYEV